jgi:predicted nucleic acid-binding protein
VECTSALARLEREGGIGRDALGAALERLRKLAGVWDEVQPATRVREIAQRLLRSHPLRAGDALQLAAAVEFADDAPGELDFVCFDQRLADAASRVGLRVIVP